MFSVKVKTLGTAQASECCSCSSPPIVLSVGHWGDEVASCFHYSFLHYPFVSVNLAWDACGLPVGSFRQIS